MYLLSKSFAFPNTGIRDGCILVTEFGVRPIQQCKPHKMATHTHPVIFGYIQVLCLKIIFWGNIHPAEVLQSDADCERQISAAVKSGHARGRMMSLIPSSLRLMLRDKTVHKELPDGLWGTAKPLIRIRILVRSCAKTSHNILRTETGRNCYLASGFMVVL